MASGLRPMSGTVTTRIKTFVDQYNSMVSTLAGLRSYEPTTKVAGPLLGAVSLLPLARLPVDALLL